MRLTKKKKQEIKHLYNMGVPVWEIAEKYGLSEAKVVEIIGSR